MQSGRKSGGSEEEDKKWLEPQHPLTFLKRAPTTFIHWSQQDGFLHLYLYDTNKGLIRQLTKGAWVVKNIIGFDEKESVVFVEGTDVIDPKTPSGAMDTHIYRVELGSGKSMRLTKGGSLRRSARHCWSISTKLDPRPTGARFSCAPERHISRCARCTARCADGWRQPV